MAASRSFSQAAASNGITQSAASQAIAQIERHLGAQLIDRTTRPLQLTSAGKAFHDGCRTIVEQYDALESTVRASGKVQQSTVRVTAIYSVGLRDMNRYVDTFQQANPGTEVRLDYQHTNRVYERVQDGAADLGLVAWPKQGRDLTTMPWKTENMVIVCAPSHPFASHKSVRPTKLRGERFVGFDRGTVIRQRIDRFLRTHGVASDTVLEFDNIENVKQAVEAGSGIALLPEPTILRERTAGALAVVELSDARFTRPLGIVRRRMKNRSPLIDRFIELLRQPDDAAPAPSPRKSQR